MVQALGRRQSISAASAVNHKGGFWFATYQEAMDGEVFVQLLKKIMHKRRKSIEYQAAGAPGTAAAHRSLNLADDRVEVTRDEQMGAVARSCCKPFQMWPPNQRRRQTLFKN